MTRQNRIAALARLAALRMEADLASLADAALRVRAAEAAIGALEEGLSQARAAAAEIIDPATIAALEGFGRWSATRRVALSRRLAEVEREASALRERAAHSFGRSKVLDRLAVKSQEAVHPKRG